MVAVVAMVMVVIGCGLCVTPNINWHQTNMADEGM